MCHQILESKAAIIVRRATPDDRNIIADVHTRSIRGLAASHYTSDQIFGWSANRIPERYPVDTEYMIVALINDVVVGFGELHLKTHEVRAVYVDPGYARKGVGHALLINLEKAARRFEIRGLHLGASLNAVEFYKAHGYYIVRNDCKLTTNGVELPYVSMAKTDL
ncbi:MAG: GNAT family N-acetyltransferase [Oligoflexales bacterium]